MKARESYGFEIPIVRTLYKMAGTSGIRALQTIVVTK